MPTDGTQGSEPSLHLSDFDPEWGRRFKKERDAVARLLGISPGDFEHFGSTAIPEMIAKPIIDVMTPVVSIDEGHRLGPTLRKIGYRPAKTDFARRVLYRRVDERGAVAFHLHLVVCPAWPIKNELLFRDWLIGNADAAAEYAALKRRLAETCGGDVQRYTMGKTEFIRGVVSKARAALGLPAETDWSE